jgi:CheY-like chemotaxis protein
MNTAVTQKHRVLVVDDESIVARSIKRLLDHDGHDVQTADSGATALAILEHEAFDLIITDYTMPDMNGVELAALIKERRPALMVVMVTAFADEFGNYGKASAGVDLVVNKPFSLQELRDAVAKVLPGKSSF